MNRIGFARMLPFAAIATAAFAASNPEGDPAQCTETVRYYSEIVECPSLNGGARGEIDCETVRFTIPSPNDGLARDYVIHVHEKDNPSSDGECLPDTTNVTERVIVPDVTWEMTVGTNKTKGTGNVASAKLPYEVCEASATFAIAASGCDPLSSSASATFTPVLDFSAPSSGRVCLSGSHHSPHHGRFEANCDDVRIGVEPGGGDLPADGSYTLDGPDIWLEGTRAGTNATLTLTNKCLGVEHEFDVVDFKGFEFAAGCGCNVLEGRESMGEYVAVTPKAIPDKYDGECCWRETGCDNPVPYLGSEYLNPYFDSTVRKGGGRVADAFGRSKVFIEGWFDCEADDAKDEGEPSGDDYVQFARLGGLSASPESGEGNKSEETGSFTPGSTVKFVNGFFAPADREHLLAVVDAKSEDKNLAMTIPKGSVPSTGLNQWMLEIPDNCPDGLFWVELRDPLHPCHTITNEFCVRSCPCSSCEDFAKHVKENGCVKMSFGLGRLAAGGNTAPLSFVLEDTSLIPDLHSVEVDDGSVVVAKYEGRMLLSFTRSGEESPVAEYELVPGPTEFTAKETRNGTPRSSTVWRNVGGEWVMETYDLTGGGRELVGRVAKTETRTGSVKTVRRVDGGVVTETDYREIPGYGNVIVRRKSGTGSSATTHWTSPVASGPAVGRPSSELSSDGSWAIYSYDASGRVASETTPFGDADPIVDDNHSVIGYNGVVNRTDYTYAPVDGRDDGSLSGETARTVVKSVGSDLSGWTEVSRTYYAEFVEDGRRVAVSERAACAGAAYGADGSLRTTTVYHWKDANAGLPCERIAEDGLVTRYAYTLSGLARTTESFTAPAAATNGVPFKTTVSRAVANDKGDAVADETWLVTDSGRILLSRTEYELDAAGHVLRSLSSDGSIVEKTWGCCGPESVRDERGVVTDYAYDSSGRNVLTVRSGVTTATSYDLSGNATNTTRIGVAQGLPALTASSSSGYDDAGRLAWTMGEDGARTEYQYGVSPEGGEIRTTIQGAGTDCAVTNTVVSYRDGSTKATYLNGVLKSTKVHEPFTSTTYEGTNGIASARWTLTETDFLGRTVSQSRPGFGGSTLVTSNIYDTVGRLVSTLSLSTRSTRPDSNSNTNTALCVSAPLRETIYLYNELGERVATVSDRNFNNSIDWVGPDLISSNDTRYVSIDGDWWRESRSFSIQGDDSDEAQLTGVSRSRVTGLGEGLASEGVSIDIRGNETTNRTYRARNAAEEINWVKYPTSATPAVTVSTNGLVSSSKSRTGVTSTFEYDGLQREVSQTDGRGNTTRTVYDNFGRVASTIDALGYATTYGYDALGRQTSVTDPLTNTVTTAYDAEGNIVSQRGATYPVDYSYDEFGDKVSMTTYRDINVAGDVTRWLRDEATGLVTNKVYADGKGPRYDYTPDGKLATRTWARGIVTTYSYDDNGSLTNTVYSDGTPTISIVYNRAGRQIEAHDAAGVTTFAYDSFGAVTNETVIGVAGTNTIIRHWDSFGRSLGYSLVGRADPSAPQRQSTLAYDPVTGRLATMLANGSDKPFTWNYLSGSDLKSSLSYPNGLTASWQYDANNQLLQVCNATPTNTISQYDYVYDAAGRRVQIARSGSAMSENRTDVYGYNARGELIFSRGDAEGAENDFAYEYDNIGNRLTSLDLGTNRTYIANNLNQYTSISNSALSASPREAFIPQFDDDGNQTLIKTATGVWQVQYNGENRPIHWSCVQSNNSNNTNNQTVLSMSYDRMGRRVTKNAQRFVYDGYLHIANFEHSTSNIELQTFIWDPTEPVATRPLMWIRGTFTECYTHDGNKNVSEVVAENGDVAAHYEYAPFGAARIMLGGEAQSNPWRFSSEYAEEDSATVYYNFRHYEPNSSRWECRDPYGERAGLSLYCFLANRGDGVCDAMGLDAIPAGVPVDEFFTNPASKKKYPLYKYVSVNAYEIVYNNSMGDFFSFIPWQKVELREYYWRVEFTARFSPPLQLQVYKYYNSWGANALGGAGDSYEPDSYVGDLPQDAWGMPTVSEPQLSIAGYTIRQDFSFENKKFRFGYFVYKADCDGCEFRQIGSNPDMYSTWYKYAARKHPTDDLVADGHRTPCQTVVVAYGDAGRGKPSYKVFKGKWRSGK